jgi:DNA-binding response OmpR family regulator
MARILIVEDEKHLADGLSFNLKAEGYDPVVATDGERALELLRNSNHYDAVILDVMLPGKSGFAIAAELRKAGEYIPILMLTARGRPEDVLKGFESGADDYLPKPFELAILLARLKGLLRRREWAQNRNAGGRRFQRTRASFAFGDKSIDFETLELQAGKQTHRLTAMEADLLHYLIDHAGKAVSRKAILEDVWELHEDTDTRAIDNFIVRLRKYVEKNPSIPKHLLTIRGVGYMFVAEPGKRRGRENQNEGAET